MEHKIVFTDRYDALGIPVPVPNTMCLGNCEGTGWVPIHRTETEPFYKKLWDEAEAKEPTDDGWHFVICPRCKGTRLEQKGD